ncbi:hypothetical protein RJ55_06589 [Drechmeria coniospora]|nr:hypothetical protein RJ55_06589 [Drechmeria coniospora]
MPSTPSASSLPIAERLTQRQIDVLVTLERIGGSVSLIAVLLIFVAYAFIRRVRNVQNTFIVFASVSNIGASVASIIALDGLQAGKETALCQAQSFMFQMFMQSDPWWSLAMAINVFLVFYYRASPDSFRRWWWVYCLICYGGPFVIALSLLLVKNSKRGPVYGEATIWCWIDPKWDGIRIYTYYMLIWICIIGSILCYFLVGYHVFRSRNQLRSFPASKSREATHCEQATVDPPTGDGFYGTVVTEVHVVRSSAINTLSEPKRAHTVGFDNDSSPSLPRPPTSTPAMYYSTVTASAPRRRSFLSSMKRIVPVVHLAASKFVIDDPIKCAYLRTSFLFALSVLVTWIPSSLNRIHSWLDGTSPYEFHVATAAVLPLQGLWNFLIFFITSWSVVKQRMRGRSNTDVSGQDGHVSADRTIDRDRGTNNLLRHPSSETEFGEADSGTLGSDVELQRVADRSTKMLGFTSP